MTLSNFEHFILSNSQRLFTCNLRRHDTFQQLYGMPVELMNMMHHSTVVNQLNPDFLHMLDVAFLALSNMCRYDAVICF